MCRAGGRRCRGSSSQRSANTQRQRRSRARRALAKAEASGDTDAITQARARLAALNETSHDTTQEKTTVDNQQNNETPGPARDVTDTEDNAATPKPTARRPLTEDEQAFLDTAKQWRQSWEGNNPNGNTTSDQHGIGTVHGNIGRVIIGGDGPIIANHTFGRDRTPRGGTTTFDTPDGQVTNTVHGQNHGQQADVVNGDITFHGPGRGFTISPNTAGTARGVTPPTPPTTRTQSAIRPDTGSGTGPVEITDSTGHPTVQIGQHHGEVWIDGRRVR